MAGATLSDDNSVDDHVNQEILDCLSLDRPRSFFLFAGAGSGKTRAVVTALNGLREAGGKHMRLHGQQVAVITYTNAACDEINRRLDFDPIVSVSTIHSFVWDLIKGFNSDLREWLRNNLTLEINELQEQSRKGRAGTNAAMERERSIEAKQKRLDSLDTIKRFVYSPTGDNRGRDSLNHSEVIKIGADFLTGKPLMQKLLISRFPIILIDESQDTNKLLMEALLAVQDAHRDKFGLGLFGDTMQRIYSDGKLDLGKNLPSDWATPAMELNHRCPKRVIRLINKIRSEADAQEQRPRSDATEGFVRLFISESGKDNKQEIEEAVRKRMAEFTKDALWSERDQVKVLTLEHHMAARRMNFFEMFEQLYKIDGLKTGLLDGSLPFVRFFSEQVLPLIIAENNGNGFASAAVVRKWSPLLSKATLEAAGEDQLVQVKIAKTAVNGLTALWSEGTQPRFIDVLRCIADNKLFDIPDSLHPFAFAEAEESAASEGTQDANPASEVSADIFESLRSFLDVPFAQIEPYAEYVKGEAAFGTHQGVKGLEFSRVLIVMDDEEARGFLFSYEKLFGAKEKSKTDVENERDGKETGIERTRRLFYVTCSRSKKSLAIVAYSTKPSKVREHALSQGWFDESEIEFLT